jgi:hypothetical protein
MSFNKVVLVHASHDSRKNHCDPLFRYANKSTKLSVPPLGSQCQCYYLMGVGDAAKVIPLAKIHSSVSTASKILRNAREVKDQVAVH